MHGVLEGCSSVLKFWVPPKVTFSQLPLFKSSYNFCYAYSIVANVKFLWLNIAASSCKKEKNSVHCFLNLKNLNSDLISDLPLVGSNIPKQDIYDHILDLFGSILASCKKSESFY